MRPGLDRRRRAWLSACCTFSALLMGIQAWAGRHFMNPDGISYLDIADRLARGHFGEVLHLYWSPLYPSLLALASMAGPVPALEFPMAHAVNWLAGLGALGAFTFLLVQWSRTREIEFAAAFACRTGFAYSLFLWGTLEAIDLGFVSPDICVAALVYLAAGLLFRMATTEGGLGTAALLGAVLGVACLAKAAMLPLGAALLGLLAIGRFRLAPPRRLWLSAVAVFALTAGAYGVALSLRAGRPTLGEAGKLNYAWLVDKRVPMHAGWTGQPPGTGTPVHPPRLLSANPPVIEFRGAVPGTFPLWYDPARFHEGLQTRFDLRKQISALGGAAQGLKWAAGTSLIPLLAGLAALLGFVPLRRFADNLSRSGLAAWTVLALGMYSAVFIQTRYLAPFFVLLWLAVYDAALPSRLRAGQRGALAAVALTLLLLQINLVGKWASSDRKPLVNAAVASELAGAGLRPGDEIAVAGNPFTAYYAKLARLRIVAAAGWTGGSNVEGTPPVRLGEVEQELRRIGVKAIVSPSHCAELKAAESRWLSLGATGHCLLPVSGAASKTHPASAWCTEASWGRLAVGPTRLFSSTSVAAAAAIAKGWQPAADW